MRLAWFSPAPAAPSGSASPAPTDDLGLLVRALASRHQIERFDDRRAHDFVPLQARRPFDLCVYELDDTPATQFVWPYLLHYPGLTLLRAGSLHRSRAAVLERQGRLDDFAREFAFDHPGATPPVARGARRIARGGWPMVRVPLLASRLTVVPFEPTAEMLRAEYPEARITSAMPGVEPLGDDDERLVVDALHWPPAGRALTDALAGFAARRAVLVFDSPETVDWPSLDPQNWAPRTGTARPIAPICVTIDPRDEAHSRRLAHRRLEADAGLRTRLAEAAHAWWRAHATVPAAAARFEAILADAGAAAPPPRPPDWPPHLDDDGTATARRVLSAFGMELPM